MRFEITDSFNGKEQDNDMSGGKTGAVYDYGFRIYDSRVAKFLSVDPLTGSYPWYTPYQFAGNKPIKFIDLDGLEQAENEIKTDVILIIEKSIYVRNAVMRNAKTIHKIYNWEVFGASNIIEGDRLITEYLKGKEMTNLVIGSHGSIGSSSMNLLSAKIDKTGIKMYLNGKSFKKESYEALKHLSYLIQPGGNLISASCYAGKDIVFLDLLKTMLNPEITFHTRDEGRHMAAKKDFLLGGVDESDWHAIMGSITHGEIPESGWVQGVANAARLAPSYVVTEITSDGQVLSKFSYQNDPNIFIERWDVQLKDRALFYFMVDK